MKCINCRPENNTAARYCVACGVCMEQACAICGRLLAQGKVFCRYCGTPVAFREPATVAKPEPAQANAGDEGYVTMAAFREFRLTAEQAIAKVKTRHRAMAEMSSDYFWETDARHGIVQTELFRKRDYDFQDAHQGICRWEFSNVISPDKAGWEAHRVVLDAHMPFRNFEFSRLSSDGVRRHFSISGNPVFDASGVFTGYRGLGTDITERKRSELDLVAALTAAEAANLAKSRFLASASHDLRQPIQAINLFSMALANTALSEEQRKISDYLALSVKSLGNLLNVLLDISKFDAGLVKPVYELMSTRTLIRNVAAEVALLVSEKGLRLKVFSRREELMSHADAKLLRSLLGNLIDNAIKYTERGGVLVGIRRRGRRLLIQVWDTGIGIAPEHVDHIFEEYFQVGNPERDRAKGLGLGLAIAKRIAGLLETEVQCRSRLGRGSVFEFSLPLADEPLKQRADRMQRENAGSDASPSLCGRRIAVIEDDWTVAVAIKLSLESRGMSVTTYANAEDALASPGIGDADFYISDLRLPGLNGRAFLDALQRRSPKRINGVILTGDISPERVELAKTSDWKVVFKPVDLPDLLAAISAQDSMP